MTKPPSPKRPARDDTDDAMLAFAEAVLDDFFEDPDNQDRYERLARGGPEPGVKAGEPVQVGALELSDDGEVGLSVHLGSPEITVAVSHPRFKATIAVRYNLGTATMTEARFIRFEGDRRTAGECADLWFDEVTLDGFDEDDETLDGFLSGDDSPFDGEDDPGEPPPPSAEDKAMVEALAMTLAREMKRKKPDMFAHQDDLLALEHSPQSLWPILDGMVGACTAGKRDPASIDAWRFLLESQLTLIRYRIDSGWDWAMRMAEEYQQKLIEIGHSGQVRPEDFAAMAGALGEAGIEVKPETRQALADSGLTLPEQEQTADLAVVMNGLMDQMAEAATDPFEVAASLSEATGVMPSEIRCFMAHEFAHSSHALLRESVPLMLLSEEQDVRRTAADALKRTATPGTMSPEALRRMIAIRNWVPNADRPPIDQAIREARTKGVECAQWPPAQDLMITASMIDGSGAQSVMLTSRGGRKGVRAGMLLKLGVGVADSWCDIEASRRDINETLATIRATGVACEVDRAYLDDAVQNAIAAGAKIERPPGGALLQIAELLGGAEWRDHRLDLTAEARRLFDALPADQRSPAAIEASLQRSGEWIEEDFAESWFLDDAEVRAIVKRAPRRDTAKVVQQLIAEVLPKRKAEWAERFLLFTLRARAAKDRTHKALATDFAILAHSLCEDRDLATIPLMAAIARHTVEVARMARW
jgi:hypothetical protein